MTPSPPAPPRIRRGATRTSASGRRPSGRAWRRDPLGFLLAQASSGEEVLWPRIGRGHVAVPRSPETIHRVLVVDAERYGEGPWTLRRRGVLGDCLITREGRPHRARRAVMQPAFERGRVARFGPAIAGRAGALADAWRDGETVEIRAEMARLALVTTGDALLSLDLEPEARTLSAALLTLGAIPAARLRRSARRRYAAAGAAASAAVRRAVARGRAEGGPADLLSALLGGEEDLSDEAVVTEVVSVLLAAVATMSTALGWTWFRLARHPEVEARVHEELDSAAGDELPYLELVLAEVLRLHPAVHFIDRRPLTEVELGGRRLAAGTFVLVSPLLTHRDPELYPDPTAFRPERWSDRESGGRPRFAYLPWGAGPHGCIGRSLARQQLTRIVATLAGRWRLRPISPSLEPGPLSRTLEMRLQRRR